MKKNEKKYTETKFISKKNMWIWLSTLAILTMTIGFCAFTSTLDIDLSGRFILVKDIRLTDVIYEDGINGGEYANNLDFSSNTFNVNIKLPQENSKVIYKLEITNYGNVEQAISKIYNIPEDLKVRTIDYNIGDKICTYDGCTRIKKAILVEISYKDGKWDGVNTEFDLNISVEFQQFYKVSYSKFENIIGFPREILGGDTYKLNYSVSEEQYLAIYMNNILLDTNKYTYENGKLTIENVEGNLKIELRNFDCLKDYEKIGTLEYNGLTVTSHGNGIYSIDGSTELDTFVRLSEYLFITTNKYELVSTAMPSKNKILKSGNNYDITFNEISGSHEITSNNKARFVFRQVGSSEAYALFGYDFYSGPFGSAEFKLEDDLGMYSLFIAAGSVFHNYKFKISVTEVHDVESEYYGPITDSITKNNFIVNFYDETNTIEFLGTNSTDLFIDLTNRIIYTARPDTSAITKPIFKTGDKVRITYEYIKNFPSTTKEISFPLRTIATSSLAIDGIKIGTNDYDLSNNIVKEYTLDQDVAIFSAYVANHTTANHYRFRINVEKIH